MTGLVQRRLPYALAFHSSLCIMVLELVAGRLVGRHVGVALDVWTGVIGIMLGGICLGNVLGGRLADRADPERTVGPLLAMGSALTVGCLWMNTAVGVVPGLDRLPWGLRTVLIVALDFLLPATVLGMIGPVVAKMAVARARRSGSALGDVYSIGAAGSIVGTFLAGFVLIYLAPTSTIIALVAAALALPGALLIGERRLAALGLAAALLLALGSVEPIDGRLSAPGLVVGSVRFNAWTLAGQLLALAFGLAGAFRLLGRRGPAPADVVGLADPARAVGARRGWEVADLALLSFVVSLVFMALEMVAGRLVSRHLESSVYGWTSVIGVLLGGLSLGNLLGGKLANSVQDKARAGRLFLVASALVLSVLLMESPPLRVVQLLQVLAGLQLDPSEAAPAPVLAQARWLHVPPAGGILAVVAAVFLLPSMALGTVGPVVAKLAVDRMQGLGRTGEAIGRVYAWGMVGSLVGTFLTGFVLIDWLGTKGVLVVLGLALALAAAYLGSRWQRAWAAVPVALGLLAFAPLDLARDLGRAWGLREPTADPATTKDVMAYTDESNYYYIRVDNHPSPDGPVARAQVPQSRTLLLDSLTHGTCLMGHPEHLSYDDEWLYALVVHRVAEAKAARARSGRAPVPMRVLFLGGGSYTFPRYLQHRDPSIEIDVAEIDPAVTEANHAALGLPRTTTIRTIFGDARRFVEAQRDLGRYDVIFGDAFNSFSLPWHLTTREFNDRLARLLTPEGVYLTSIIDAYESDAHARSRFRADPKARGTEAEAVAAARRKGGFLGAWIATARQTFPYLAVFGNRDQPGSGGRETFVVIASRSPLDLADLGRRPRDPRFRQGDSPFVPRPYGPDDLEALKLRSRGILLTDDYAPVENLLANVPRTRSASDE